MAQVEKLLLESRLLTLTGPGGSGKTRLALAVASGQVGRFDDGVWLMELAPISDPDFVVQALARALDVPETPGRSLTETITDDLRELEILLVLDNCEHLVEACAFWRWPHGPRSHRQLDLLQRQLGDKSERRPDSQRPGRRRLGSQRPSEHGSQPRVWKFKVRT